MYNNYLFFFSNDTATTELYTLSLHDALPISCSSSGAYSTSTRRSRPTGRSSPAAGSRTLRCAGFSRTRTASCYRSEEHTSELQSHVNLVCRLLLEKKKYNIHSLKYLCIYFNE